MKVAQKLIIVTGAGGGLGRELTLCLLLNGARVIALDRSQPSLDYFPALRCWLLNGRIRTDVFNSIGGLPGFIAASWLL